ncbi:hypothetical protein [Candidatus Avelusimicrobium gallicola]|uniref:Uncharacterized protein n=1 Tax=Candidatus Avelusimicrobium gallicola TaxID=2562704 RepID=A0A1Y4DC27_9BACT|nr:hypothetical protein [Elusimicrobium sp. An273]OUO56606.1 hypothetical protein B5F75_05285 [Elusimicrobium sp. An273]
MKKILVLLVVLLLESQSVVFGQSAYQLVRVAKRAKFKPVSTGKITGHVQAPLASASLAQYISSLRKPTSLRTYTQNRTFANKLGTVTVPEIHIELSFPAPILRSPSTLWGSYHYLRVLTSLSRERGAVHPKYIPLWKSIFYVGGYNGVHHIVNKSTLKEIYATMKREAMEKGQPWTIRLDELQRNAPGSLHPFHGRPEFSVLFHNIDRQLALYQQGGIRAIIIDYFDALDAFHKMYPNEAPFIPPHVRQNTLLEAKLWSETFHLKWE